MAQRVSKENFEEKVLKSTVPVLVDFYSDSCVPCKMISPILGDLEDEKEGSLAVYKLNVNFDGEIAEQYSVMGAPTLIFFENGEIKDRKTGALKKDQLFEWVEGLLAK
ncbi:MAG: thioredoxin [Lachnospiraceae bacterium]